MFLRVSLIVLATFATVGARAQTQGQSSAQASAAPRYDLISSVEAVPPGSVGQQPWSTRTVNLKVLSQDVRSILKIIAGEASVPIAVDQNLTAPVSNVTLQGNVPAVLDKLAEAASLVWWWNGSEVKVVDRRDVQSRVWKVGDAAELQTAVRDMGIPESALRLQDAGGLGMVRVSGPRALLVELEPMIKTLAARSGEVRILRYGRQTTEKTR